MLADLLNDFASSEGEEKLSPKGLWRKQTRKHEKVPSIQRSRHLKRGDKIEKLFIVAFHGKVRSNKCAANTIRSLVAFQGENQTNEKTLPTDYLASFNDWQIVWELLRVFTKFWLFSACFPDLARLVGESFVELSLLWYDWIEFRKFAKVFAFEVWWEFSFSVFDELSRKLKCFSVISEALRIGVS